MCVRSTSELPKKKLYSPLVWIGCNYLKAPGLLREVSLLVTCKTRADSRTHLNDLGR